MCWYLLQCLQECSRPCLYPVPSYPPITTAWFFWGYPSGQSSNYFSGFYWLSCGFRFWLRFFISVGTLVLDSILGLIWGFVWSWVTRLRLISHDFLVWGLRFVTLSGATTLISLGLRLFSLRLRLVGLGLRLVGLGLRLPRLGLRLSSLNVRLLSLRLRIFRLGRRRGFSRRLLWLLWV